MRYIILVLISIGSFGLTACQDKVHFMAGAKGDPGAPGNSCAVNNTPGGALISCTDGSSAFIGNGHDGGVGPSGPSGAPGSPGLNATPITIVNLCPGVTTYPTTFVEVGFCINNNLYAVYSENNGFLTYVPPGSYSSNAHGSSCSLVVHTNCVVTH